MNPSTQEAILSLIERVTSQQQTLSHLEIKYESRKHVSRSIESEMEALEEMKYQHLHDREELHRRNKELGDKVNKLRYEIETLKHNKNDMKMTIESLKKTIESLKVEDDVMKESYKQKLSQRMEILQRFNNKTET